jgi:hypothetical protein
MAWCGRRTTFATVVLQCAQHVPVAVLTTMSDFDVDAFITELERLGLKLTATRLLDGTIASTVGGCRMLSRTHSIEELWATHIGDDKARMLLLGTRLARRASNPKGEREVIALSLSNGVPLRQARHRRRAHSIRITAGTDPHAVGNKINCCACPRSFCCAI